MASRILQRIRIYAISLCVLAICPTVHGYAASPPVVAVQPQLSNGMAMPFRLTMAPAGDIYVADPNNGAILHYDTYGKLLKNIPTPYNPRAVVLTADGRLIVSFGNYVSVMTANGTEVRKLGTGVGQFQGANGIALDSAGYIYVADGIANNVKVFNAAGDYAYSFGAAGYLPGQFYQPSGIAFDPTTNQLAVVDKMNGRVEFFDVTGNYIRSIGSLGSSPLHFTSPTGIAFEYGVDPVSGKSFAKRMYVVDTYQSTVQVVDPSGTGTFLSFIGSYGNHNGNLVTPIDAVFDSVNSRLLVTNGLGYVTIFGIDGGTSPVVKNIPPTVPSPISPIGGSEVNALYPPLTIGNSTDADGDTLTYEFEVMDANNNVVASYAGVPSGSAGTTTALVDKGLVEDQNYTWHARAFDGIDHSAWSVTSSFYYNAVNEAPSVPKVITPLEGAKMDSTSIFSWAPSTDPDKNDTISYTLEISSTQDFSAMVAVEPGITDHSKQINSLKAYSAILDNTTYYWRVKAVDNHGLPSGYDGTHSFVFDTTTVSISANMPDTKVYVGATYSYPGRYLGKAPLTVKDLAPGTYELAFEHSGFETYYTQLTLADAGSDPSVYAKLKGAKEIRYVNGNPLRTIDGKVISATAEASPLIIDFSDTGSHDLLLAEESGNVSLYRQQLGVGDTNLWYLKDDGFALNAGASPVLTAADFTSRGIKDLIAGNQDGTVSLYLNSGTEQAPVYDKKSAITLPPPADGTVKTNAAPAVVDLDNDGLKDIIVGYGDGSIYYYKNTGSDVQPAFDAAVAPPVKLGKVAAIAPQTAANAVPFVCDWEADGAKDLAVGTASGDVYLYSINLSATPALTLKNASFGTGLKKTALFGSIIKAGADSKPFIGEIDQRDGKDLLVGTGDGKLALYSSNGAQFVSAYSQALLDKSAELLGLAAKDNTPSGLVTLLNAISTAISEGKLGKAADLAQTGGLASGAWTTDPILNGQLLELSELLSAQ